VTNPATVLRTRDANWIAEAQMAFLDRTEAGIVLSSLLTRFAGQDVIVLGLPPGGVPVAYEVAAALRAPLDVWVARKVGTAIQPELGVGGVAEGGGLFLDPGKIRMLGVSAEEIAQIVRDESDEVEDRVRLFRKGRPAPRIRSRIVILVDDGIAVDGRVRAAIRAIRKLGPARLILAVPVVAASTVDELRHEVDEIVSVVSAEELWAISSWYLDFRPMPDEEAIVMLEAARARLSPHRALRRKDRHVAETHRHRTVTR
jgi:putative phosphoribosyl transferase